MAANHYEQYDEREAKHIVAGLFGRVADEYDQGGFLHEVARRLVARSGVKPGARVLDVACGTGAALLEAACLAGPDGFMVGVDLAEPMAARTARRLETLDHAGPAGTAMVMDAERLGFQAASFDVVYCASAIYALNDQAAAIGEFLRLLRPSGVLAISEFGDLDGRWNWKGELLERFAPPLLSLGGGHLAPAELRDLLSSEGAREVQIEVDRLDVVYPDSETWWASEWTHGERRPLERMDEEALEAYRQAAFEAIEVCREADGAFHWRPEAVYAIASI
jgi:ubiquinone/menaquinone biosynthesis C-methylase UbiE